MEILGEKDSNMFLYFKFLFLKGLFELRKNIDYILFFIQLMKEKSDLPCFYKFDMKEVRSRFLEYYTDQEVI